MKDKHDLVIVDVQTFDYHMCTICMCDKEILLKPLQVVILAFKVDWLIDGGTCALNNMLENIPP